MRNVELVLMACMAWGLNACSQGTGQEEASNPCDEADWPACNEAALALQSGGDYEASAELLEQACQGGYPVACSNLGELYFDGQGVDQDLKRSLSLFGAGCNAKLVSGCAGVCLVAAQSGALTPELRDACGSALRQSCGNGNEWMCKQRLAESSSPAPSDESAHTCEGDALQRTTQLVERMWLGALQVAFNTDDFGAALQATMQLIEEGNAERAKLPRACQVVFDEWARIIAGGSAADSGNAQCVDDICCDGQHCYN